MTTSSMIKKASILSLLTVKEQSSIPDLKVRSDMTNVIVSLNVSRDKIEQHRKATKKK